MPSTFDLSRIRIFGSIAAHHKIFKDDTNRRVYLRIYNLPETTRYGKLKAASVGKFVSIQGVPALHSPTNRCSSVQLRTGLQASLALECTIPYHTLRVDGAFLCSKLLWPNLLPSGCFFKRSALALK